MGKNRLRHLSPGNDHRLNLLNTDAVDFVPVGAMILAEKVDLDATAAGLVLPEAFADSTLIRWRATDVGPDVTRVKVGDEFIVGNNVRTASEGGVMFEVPGRTIKTRLIHQDIVICLVRMPQPGAIVGADGVPRPSLLEP